MYTPDFEIHRALVLSSNTSTGKVLVKIPALLGNDGSVEVQPTGLVQGSDGTWVVPSVGTFTFVAVSSDRTKFFWVFPAPEQVPALLTDGSRIADYLEFNNVGPDVLTEGQVAWNEDEGTIDIGMHRNSVVLQVGQETVYYVKNQTGSTITNGTVVRFVGSLGASGRLKVAPFLADGTYRSAYLMGIATEDIPNGEDGYVTHFGKVRNLNTTQDSEGNALVDGDLLYASATVPGGYTKIEPSAPNNRILLAAVVKAHANQGTLFVRPAFPTSLLDNEVVNVTSIANNDILVYNGTTGVFENRPIPSISQVVSTTKTDTFAASVTAGSGVAVTGLTAVITPSSTSSKVLVTVSVTAAQGESRDYPGIQLTRDGSPIALGDAEGIRSRVATAAAYSTSGDTASLSFTFLDAPASTSAVTYGVALVNINSSGTDTMYLNRAWSDSNNSTYARAASTITVMEVIS